MYKYLSLISLVLFINYSQAEPSNVLENGGFESGGTVGVIIYAGNVTDGWYGSRAAGAPPKMLDSEEPLNDNRYVRFIADINNNASWSYIRHTSTQTWKSDHRYRYRMKIRVSDGNGDPQEVPENAVLTIKFIAIDNGGTATLSQWSNFDLSDFGPTWHELGIDLFAPDPSYLDQLIRVQVQIVGVDTPDLTYVDVDDVVLEEVHDVAMVPITDHMMIATNMAAPNWFTSIAEGTERAQVNASYYLDVPLDVTIDAAGGHALANTISLNPPVYTVTAESVPVVHDGENYTRYKLVPSYSQMHTLDDWVGPIFLSTTGTDGTKAKLFYHTTWLEGGNVITSEEYSLSLEYRKFPEVGKPELLYSSLSWIRIAEQLVWPDFLGAMDKLGFNTISANRFALKCPSNNSNCNESTETIYASQQTQDFLSDAENLGFYRVQNDSSFAGLNSTTESWVDGNLAVPISHAPSPCYRGFEYGEQLLKPYTLGVSFQPDLLFYDIELFKEGATTALTGTDYHCGNPFTAADLIVNGTEIASDLTNAWGGGLAPIPLRGFYSVYQAGPTYSDIFKYESMKNAAAIDLSQPRYYWDSPQQSGDDIRIRMADGGNNHQFVPWIDGGIVNDESVPAHVYDRATEMYGSGAKGIAWFSFRGSEASDFYYYAKAMEAIAPVESLIVNANAIDDPIVITGNVNVTGIKGGNEILLLVSSYGNEDSGYSDELSGDPIAVTLQLPEVVSVHPIALATRSSVGAVTSNSDNVTFDFTPGVTGARTALIYLCDPSLHSCVDADGDGLNGYEDNCPDDVNPNQTDTDNDGIGNVCDQETLVLTSIAAEDGWVRESLESSDIGNKAVATGAGTQPIRFGDNSKRRQYKAIVSFDNTLPSAAILTAASLSLTHGTDKVRLTWDTRFWLT